MYKINLCMVNSDNFLILLCSKLVVFYKEYICNIGF